MNSGAIHHPANAGFRHHFEERHRGSRLPPLTTPDQVSRPYETLGAHPDLVERLWDQLAGHLPFGCRIVFYGVPALMHPSTGVVFGFATGTHTYALRLPELERAQALQAGATRVTQYRGVERSFDLDDLGPEWIFCGWFAAEEAWCRAAFELAGTR